MKKSIQAIFSHLRLLFVRGKQDLADPNQTWMVIVLCLLSLATALRMADVAGWVRFGPVVRAPAPSSLLLIQQGNQFWNAATNAGESCVLLLTGSVLVLVSRLERWRQVMTCGLFLLMAWWWVTAATVIDQLGFAVGGWYLAVAVTSCVTSIKTLRAFDERDIKEAEVDESLKLVGMVMDLSDSDLALMRNSNRH